MVEGYSTQATSEDFIGYGRMMAWIWKWRTKRKEQACLK